VITETSKRHAARIMENAPCKCGVCYAEALLFGYDSRPAKAQGLTNSLSFSPNKPRKDSENTRLAGDSQTVAKKAQ
jgi:hypothetical protein